MNKIGGNRSSSLGVRLRIVQDNGSTYELFFNTPIPENIKIYFIKKGISFTETLE